MHMNTMSLSNNQNTSFGMNIHFKPRNDYAITCAKCNLPLSARSGHPAGWAIKNAARGKNKLYTEFAADCNVIGFSNRKRAFMRHLIPNGKNLEMKKHEQFAPLKKRLLSRLQKEVDTLKAEGKIKTVFITAGQPRENMKSRSISLLKGLVEFCRSNGLEPTIIWGQKGNYLDALFDIKKDTLNLQPYMNVPIFPETIKSNFSWMKFNKHDKIFAPDGRRLSKAYLSKQDELSVPL